MKLFSRGDARNIEHERICNIKLAHIAYANENDKLSSWQIARALFASRNSTTKEREGDFNFSSFHVRRPFGTLSKRVRQPARMTTFVASFRGNPRRHSAEITSWKTFPRLSCQLSQDISRTARNAFGVLKSLPLNDSPIRLRLISTSYDYFILLEIT